MKFAGSKLTLLTCIFIRFFVISTDSWINYVLVSHLNIPWTIFKGIVFLFYPVFGWIADIRITHYRMIKVAFVLVSVSSLTMLAATITLIIKPNIFQQNSLGLLIALSCITIILMAGTAGLGMYEANAIQFGMDQMLEASSEELSSFIHWYYWSLHIGPLVIFYILIILLSNFQNCKIDFDHMTHIYSGKLFSLLEVLTPILQVVITVLGLFTLHCAKKNFNIDTTRLNPIKMIFHVLKYAWKHKYPVNRSAFTYWENDIPPRIDLSKHKYGGPFTNEQVEDVKTLLRLFVLVISLFGFQLSGNGYSLNEHMLKRFGCPTLWPMLLIVMNSEHVSHIVILTSIPLYQFVIRKYMSRFIPNLLSSIWFGLMCVLLRETFYPLTSIIGNFPLPISGCLTNILDNSHSLVEICRFVNTKVIQNGTCGFLCYTTSSSNNIFILLLVPQILHGLSYLLVFMTVLEFICAQSPQTMKGLLIGIWYATLSIKYLVVNILDGYVTEESTWNIYHGVKGFGIFLSIVTFSLVCKFYRYRERDEIVNEQAIIEEQYERELLYNRENSEEDDEIIHLNN